MLDEIPRGALSPALKSIKDFSTCAGVKDGRTTDALNDGAAPRLLPVYEDLAESPGVISDGADI